MHDVNPFVALPIAQKERRRRVYAEMTGQRGADFFARNRRIRLSFVRRVADAGNTVQVVAYV